MAVKSSKKPRKTASSKQAEAQPISTVTPISSGVNGGEAQNRGSQPQTVDIQEQIRLRAYELFVERGRQEGFAREDWDRAEAEVLAKYQREKSA